MPRDVEQQFLQLGDSGSHAVPALPPAIRIKCREARRSNQHSGLMSAHRTSKHAPNAARVIGRAHDDDRAKLLAVAPGRKQRPFGFGPVRGFGDDFNPVDAERVKKLDAIRRGILEMNAPANQLVLGGQRRLGQHRDAARDPRVHEIGRIDRT